MLAQCSWTRHSCTRTGMGVLLVQRDVRVLHYGLSWNCGGIENALLRYTTHVDRDVFRFDFLCSQDSAPCHRRALSEFGCRFFPIRSRRTSPRGQRRDIEAVIAGCRYDVVHCHLNTLSYVTPVAVALKQKIPTIVHSRNAGTKSSMVTLALHVINGARLPWQRITKAAVSAAAAQWLFGASTDVHVINNGIEVSRFSFNMERRLAIRSELGLGDHLVIGHVGAFLEAKNHALIVEVFSALLASRPSAALVLVGGGPGTEAIRNMVASMGLAEHVHFLGPRTDVPDLLSAFDVFLFPSKYEGFPNAVLEAQTSGLPCVVSNRITPEVLLSDHCTVRSLADPVPRWVDAILSAHGPLDRVAEARIIDRSGFSAQDEAIKLQNLYELALQTRQP